MLALALLPVPAGAYKDGPPPAHTGGLGEPDCAACHFGPEPESRGVSLSLQGMPERYDPGSTYRITLVLEAAGMKSGGMLLSVRTHEGRQAGTLAPGDDLETVQSGGIHYLRHVRPARGPEAVWRLAWTAPEECAGPVLMHAAANAANDDDSALGDVPVLAEATSLPPLECGK